jgi:hypothetical protein
LFFPTVHVHDGHRADPEAGFDHDLYAQLPWPTPEQDSAWEVGALLPAQMMDVVRLRGLVAPDVPLRRARLHGDYPNGDVVVLRGEGGMKAEVRTVRTGLGVGPRMGWKEFQAKRRGGYGGRY